MALRASGEEFPIEASISQTTVNEKRIYTAIVRDVTEAVLHRQQIEHQAQILDQISDAVSVVDLTGRITYWNQAACRLYGWTEAEVLGRNAYEILYRGDTELLREMLREANARRSWAGELTKVSRSGKTIIVDHRRTVLQNDTGAVTGYLCIDIDITDRKKYERAARRSQRLESIGTLAGGIAHDLNNVLTPILMGAKLLSSGRVPANKQGLLNTMVASAERGAGLIKQLLAFAGGIRGERSPVDINQLIAETRGLLEHSLPKSIQIDIQSDIDCPPVLGDATELSQILTNLCINARDAMPNGGTLTIEATSLLINGNAIVEQLTDESHIVNIAFDHLSLEPTCVPGQEWTFAGPTGIHNDKTGFVRFFVQPRKPDHHGAIHCGTMQGQYDRLRFVRIVAVRDVNQIRPLLLTHHQRASVVASAECFVLNSRKRFLRQDFLAA